MLTSNCTCLTLSVIYASIVIMDNKTKIFTITVNGQLDYIATGRAYLSSKFDQLRDHIDNLATSEN